MCKEIIVYEKEKRTPIKGWNNAFTVEDYYEDEPISNNIRSSIDDFYNVMHLIKKSWSNKKYRLKMKDAGYNIYDENKVLSAWIGIKEKSGYILFIIYGGELYSKAYKDFKGPMVVYDFDEYLWVYSELQLSDITEEASFEKQREIIAKWIHNDINKIR